MTTILTFKGRCIRLRGVTLNLTDMWKAAGRPDNRHPDDWLSLEETRRLRTHADAHGAEEADGGSDPLGSDTDRVGICHPDDDGLVAGVRGDQGGTWAHWQLALSYGRYLSPTLHIWCNTVVRAAMERAEDPPRPAPPRPRATPRCWPTSPASSGTSSAGSTSSTGTPRT